MLEEVEPFRKIMRYFTLIGFTSKKYYHRTAHRVISTFCYLFFGVLLWTLTIMSIPHKFADSKTFAMYVLYVPTVFGLVLKSLKVFFHFKPIEDFLEFSDTLFSAQDFQPYFDRAIRRARIISNIQLTGYSFVYFGGILSVAHRGRLAIPLIFLGDGEKLFWAHWIYGTTIGGFLTITLLAALNLLPICSLLVIHEYVLYMNDSIAVINRLNQYDKLKKFLEFQQNFKT